MPDRPAPPWAALFAKPEQADQLSWGREPMVFAASDAADLVAAVAPAAPEPELRLAWPA
ncbi:hypothetical protein [Virgisporangium aurantiacum]|uniref:Uncharacterized protein n=1 Tax=Virgisporangium aurantiacum TaxID=175570 RepID=A0A8J4E3L6_9ACTN|nr:hypothetical protein [Virgisporangium aurantiacum]GIJ60073.1 hypothetical protein Vau01_075890 [Virgisporangium aurantiacum]